MKTIVRSEYLQRLISLKNTPDIKVITGIRRSGKSKLMQSFQEYIQNNEENANIINVDFFDLKYEEYNDYKKLYTYVESNYNPKEQNYLFVDEVQMCKDFELAINSLYSSGKYDIYITGSNAFLLSSDLATLFTGRYIEMHVFPFSFKEYCLYFENENNKTIDDKFDDYVKNGGLSGSYVYKTENDKMQYIKGVCDTIIKRDLVDKYKIADTNTLENLFDYMMDNVSNLTSPNNIADTLTNNKISTNHVTIGKYISYLCKAFLLYDIKRYDIKGKKYLETNKKYYLSDVGIRYAKLGTKNMDFGRVYENIVCIELLRRGYEVYVGKLYQKEVDFVAIRNNEKIYIQVSDDITGQETFTRECDSLLKIQDAYPKMIIARTHHEDYSYEGIQIKDLPHWLLEK